MKKTLAFVVLTCDAYADLWDMYTHFFHLNWPDCPYDSYFVTNDRPASDPAFRSILVGRDETWSGGLLKALDQLEPLYDYLLIALEDLPIVSPVNQSRLDATIQTFLQRKGQFITFRNYPKPTQRADKTFGRIDKDAPYRLNCVYALWDVRVLRTLLRKEESAWQFERLGASRSAVYDGFYAVYTNHFNVRNTVVKGHWVPSECRRLVRLGYTPDSSKRALFTKKEALRYSLRLFGFNLFHRYLPLPPAWKRTILDQLRTITLH